MLQTTGNLSALNVQEQKLIERYGKLPAKKNFLGITKERKYFDSGDYNMHMAGLKPEQPSGTAIPTPERLPHIQPPSSVAESTVPQEEQETVTARSTPVMSETIWSPDQQRLFGSGPTAETRPVAVPLRSAARRSMDLGPHELGFNRPSDPLTRRRPSVGVADIAVPNAETYDSRGSPPRIASFSQSSCPPSSFPIQSQYGSPTSYHQAMSSGQVPGRANSFTHVRSGSVSGLGSSPVRPSALGFNVAREDRVAIDEMAVED